MVTIAPAASLRDARGGRVTLAEKIGEGGEGRVFLIAGQPERVAKIYAQPPDSAQLAKLEAMIESGDEALRRVAAWPDGLLYDGATAVGFSMPKLASQHALHELFGPKRRQTLFPDAHWRFLIHAASNIALAFAAMHEREIVVGDVNSNNVVVHGNSKTRFIDCDSFQIERGGRLFRCNVGVPEYQPPELQTVDLSSVPRLPQHDRFGLAVMVFQLLFVGKHPFAGILPPHLAANASIGANIAAGRFFYSRDAAREGLRPPPGSLALAAMPPEIEDLFLRAFCGPPAARPGALEWRDALRDLEQATVVCDRSRLHRHLRGEACPWCELERRGLHYFIVPAADKAPVDDSAWERFPDAEVERLWAEMAAIAPLAPMPDPVGRRPPLRLRPLDSWRALQRVPAADRRARLEQLREPFRTGYARWRRLTTNVDFRAERARLAELHTALTGQRARRDADLAQARAEQLRNDANAYLALFPIPRVAQVPGSLVTPSGPTTGIDHRVHRELARYGITTGADISLERLRGVAHLRSWRIDVLMEWRGALEAQFADLPVRELEPAVQREIVVRHARERERNASEFSDGAARLHAIVEATERERAELAAALPALAAAVWAAEAEAQRWPVFART